MTRIPRHTIRNRFDVIVPARNEAETIRRIVQTLTAHRAIHRVIVPIDPDTMDDTYGEAYKGGGYPIMGRRGKGQNATVGLRYAWTDQVLFCDADYTGLSGKHITRLTWHPATEMHLIGVPDFPAELPNAHAREAFPWVSGIRRIPRAVALSIELHGYCMEVCLNAAGTDAGLPVMFTRLHGLKSPWDGSPQRMRERDRDFRWLQSHLALQGITGKIKATERKPS